MQRVSLRQAVSTVLDLLPRKYRVRIGLLALAQAFLGVLDLAGIFILAALTVALVNGMATNAGGGFELPSWFPVDGSSSSGLLIFGIVSAALLVGKSVLASWLLRLSLKFLARREAEVAHGMARALLAAPPNVISRAGIYVNAWSVGGGVSQLVTQTLSGTLTAFGDVMLLALLTVSLLLVNPALTLVTLLYFIIVLIFLYRFVARRATIAGARSTEAANASVTALVEAQSGYRELSVLNRRDHYLKRFAALRTTTAETWAQLLFLAMMPKIVIEVVLVLAIVILVGAQMFASDPAQAASLLAIFLAASARILPAIIRLQSSLTVVRQAIASSDPVFKLIDELKALAIANDRITASSRGELDKWAKSTVASAPTGFYPGFAGTVVLDRVSFVYPGSDVSAVEDVSFEVLEGEHVAIVGSSGAGKSTLLDLILGILTPDAGTIRLTGVTPQEAIEQWPGALAYVPQQAFLTAGTVAENVALGLPIEDHDAEAIWRALRLAHLDDVVLALPGALQARLDEQGSNLSGGQRQRMGLARALYSAPRLLLLDEATSSLDAETENLITDAVQSMRGDVTTITVAHRWATVRDADRIFYMSDGRIIASGTFDELVAELPDFAHQAALMNMVDASSPSTEAP